MNYKMMGRLIAQILLAEAAFMVPAPVSYTHLDVYKRQEFMIFR